MPISMTCPHCGARFSFADDNRGKKARCQRCQSIFTIDEPPPEVAALPDLELAEPPKPRPAPPPAPRPAPPSAAKPRKQDTSADDFDPASMGLSFDVGGGRVEESQPVRSTSKRSKKQEDSGGLFDDYKDEEPETRPSRKKGGSAFSHGQNAGEDRTAERASGAPRRPWWVKILIMLACWFIPGASEIHSIVGDGTENPIERMKKKIIRWAIIFGVFMILACGGMLAFLAVIANKKL